MDLDLTGTEPINPAASQPVGQPAQTPGTGLDLSGTNVIDPQQAQQAQNEEKYGQFGQLEAGAEGAAEGVLGPIAPALEVASGITTPENIRGRAETYPGTHEAAKAATFAGSLLVPGLGEASLAGQAANIGEHFAPLLPEGASLISKIAATGVKTGAEMAALQTSDELSKMVTQDPNQSLQTAAINIGLSGVIGGIGGAAIGSISPLWNKAANKMGVERLATDYMGESQFLRDNPDLVHGAAKELSNRMEEAGAMRETMNETKPEILAKVMPEVTQQNAAKIDSQIEDVSGKMASAIDSASRSVKTKSAVPYIAEDFMNFQNAVTDPNAGFSEKFQALNKLKTTLADYAKWGLTEEGSAKAAMGRELSNMIRPMLEDTGVWGAAGDVQRVTNEATTNVIRATKDLKGQVTSKLMGEESVAPEKVQTLINQTQKGKLGRKASVVGNYLDYTQKQADAIAKVHLDNGLDIPESVKLNPTTVLDHSLNTPLSTGVKLARWAKNGGAAAMSANVAGHAAGEIVGGGLGFMVGHPLAGAWMGDKILKPVFSALAKPLAEKAINSEAAKAATDYVGTVAKGQKVLNNAIGNFFSSGSKIIANDLIPDQESREKLKKSLEYAQNPSNLMNAGGSLGHYLPDHATAAAATASTAVNYLNSLKPKEIAGGPLDEPIPADKHAEASYNRALDIAQQPLMTLQHAKNGTILPQDVQTLNTIYPALKSQIVSQLGQEMIKAKADKVTIPYQQKIGLSMLMGYPVDSTMTAPSLQSILIANAPKGPPPAPPGKQKKVSQSSSKMMTKNDQMYATPQQARAADKVDRT